MTDLSIIIPAYNEQQNILAGKLTEVKYWSYSRDGGAEIILIDDGSTDHTAEWARCCNVNVYTIEHAGKAGAIMGGIHVAKGDNLLIIDMDLATPISEADRLLRAQEAFGYDVVVGSRGLSRAGAPLQRYILAYGQMALRWLLTGLSIDTQCGFKLIRRDAALKVLEGLVIYKDIPVRGDQVPNVASGFDVELLYVARRLGYQVAEVPVEWRHQESRRVHALRDAWRGSLALIGIFSARILGQYPKVAGGGFLARINWSLVVFFILIAWFAISMVVR